MLSDADTIALTRSLWPGVTVAAASDAFLGAWLTSTRLRVDLCVWGDLYDTAVAHLLAHQAYRIDPAGVLGTAGAAVAGQVTSIRTGALSATVSDASSRVASADADLATTGPGAAYLALRDSLASLTPFVVSL